MRNQTLLWATLTLVASLLATTNGSKNILRRCNGSCSITAMFPFSDMPFTVDDETQTIEMYALKEMEDANANARRQLFQHPSETDTSRNLERIALSDTPGLSHLASYLLGVQHFNERNPIIVASLQDDEFARNCSLRLRTRHVLDTRSSARAAVQALISRVYSQEVPEIVLGGYREFPVLDLSTATSGLSIPFITFGGLNQRVVTPYFFPHTLRLSPDVRILATRLTEYLLYRGRKSHVAMLYATSDTRQQLATAITLTESFQKINRTISFSYVPPAIEATFSSQQSGTIQGAMKRISKRGFRTVVLMMERLNEELPTIAQAAAENGMLGDQGWFWVIVGSIDFWTALASSQQNPHVRRLLNGSAFFMLLDGFSKDRGVDDKFLSVWRQQNETFVNHVNHWNPLSKGRKKNSTDTPAQELDDYHFQNTNPDFGSSFAYDAAILTGMGLCRAQTLQGEKARLTKGLRSVKFQGASGQVQFGGEGDYPGQRVGSTFSFGIYNLRLNSTPMVDLTDIVLSSSENGNEDATWRQVPGARFIFGDGTENPPPLQTLPEQNHLSPTVRYTGFAVWGGIILIILSSAIWIIVKQKVSIVKASQPIFLLWMLLGCSIFSLAILSNSFDEGSGWNTSQLGVLCTLTPWFLVIGHIIIYSTLFAKLWRVNKVLQFRRTTVTLRQVLWPVALILVIVLLVLSIWTALEGFYWARIEVDPVTEASVGKCQGIHTSAYFTPITALTLLPTFLTLCMAYKTRDVDSLYSESRWIYTLIILQFQALFIAIPVLYILEETSNEGRYIGQLMIFVTFALSPIFAVIFPKIYDVHFTDKNKGKTTVRGQRNSGVRVSGLKSTLPEISAVRSSTTSLPPSRNGSIQTQQSGVTGSLVSRSSTNSGPLVVVQEDTEEKSGIAQYQLSSG